jgi:GR25 family glycosyltransferase involved in LPS biosynthesis
VGSSKKCSGGFEQKLQICDIQMINTVTIPKPMITKEGRIIFILLYSKMDNNVGYSFLVVVAIISLMFLLKPIVIVTEEFSESCINPVLKDVDFEIYLINLDRNQRRLQLFLNQYQASDLRFKTIKRVPAVDGKKLDITQYLSDRAFKEIKSIETTGYRTKHYQLTRGAVGCYLSHLKTYKQIADSDKEFGLIFEDDVNIAPDFYVKLNVILKKIPNNWDVLLLGCHCLKCKKHEVHSHVRKFILLHCYIVKKAAAKELFSMLNKKPIEQQIDSELSDILINSDKFTMYCINDAIAWQNNTFATEIQVPVKMTLGVNPFDSVI